MDIEWMRIDRTILKEGSKSEQGRGTFVWLIA